MVLFLSRTRLLCKLCLLLRLSETMWELVYPHNEPVKWPLFKGRFLKLAYLDTIQLLFLFPGPLVVWSLTLVYVGRPGRVAPSILGVNRFSDYMLGSWYRQVLMSLLIMTKAKENALPPAYSPRSGCMMGIMSWITFEHPTLVATWKRSQDTHILL